MTQPALTYDQPSEIGFVARAKGMPLAGSQRHYGGGTVIGMDFLVARDWTQTVQRRLLRLLKLPVGWDGYRAKKVSPTVAAFAWNVLESVMRPGTPAPSVVPVAGGGIQLEWHEGGVDIELFISKPMKAELYVAFEDDRPPVERDLGADFSELSKALEAL
jgi:hypothetical protein